MEGDVERTKEGNGGRGDDRAASDESEDRSSERRGARAPNPNRTWLTLGWPAVELRLTN